MALGADAITIMIGGELIELRPTLRAAMRLSRRHGFEALYAGALDFHTGIIMDVLREAASAPVDLLAEIAAIGLGPVRAALTKPLCDLTLALAGYDPDAEPSPATGELMPLAAFHTRLFEIATGSLGWTPEQAWLATPAEIIAANKGRTELISSILRAVFGTPQEDEQPASYRPVELNADGLDPAFDRAGLQALKAKIAA